MKYSIIKVINGNFSIHAETSNINNAKVNFHGLCQTLWNAQDVLTGNVMIADEQLNCVDGYREAIRHDPQPEPEPVEEPVAE